MNALEMHIDTDITTQKISSNLFRRFDPAQIDWLLNREVERFIKDRIKEDKDSLGFEASEVDLDAIRTLVVNDQVLLVRKKNPTDRTVFGWLPGDYSYLIDDFSIVLQSCHQAEYKAATTFSTTDEYIYAFPLKASSLSSGPFYVNSNITLNAGTIISQSSGPGLPTSEELFTYRYYLLNQLWSLPGGNITWFWERYGTLYKQGCILAVTNTQQTGANTITIDGVTTNATETIQAYVSAPIVMPHDIDDQEPTPNRLIKGSARSNVLKSAFARSRASSIVSSVDGNLLRAYHDTKFIVNSLIISYIRKPRKISLSLGQDCDLPEEFHSQIVDRTGVTIKELTMNPDWQIALQSMMMNKD